MSPVLRGLSELFLVVENVAQVDFEDLSLICYAPYRPYPVLLMILCVDANRQSIVLTVNSVLLTTKQWEHNKFRREKLLMIPCVDANRQSIVLTVNNVLLTTKQCEHN